MKRPHVVILGAGFGGVYVAKRLCAAVNKGEIDLTIINKTNNFLFTPLLHEVATGGLNPRNVAEPLREIFVHTKARIIEGLVESIDPRAKSVRVRGQRDTIHVGYDRLVIATGAETNYYGIPGAAENAMPLKTIRDAAAIRNRVIDSFEQAVLTESEAERREYLSFVVVGGGATGVEVAAELEEFIEGMVSRYYGKIHCRPGDPRHCKRDEVSMTLIHAGKELLEPFAKTLRERALQHLGKKGIDVRLATSVTSITDEEVSLSTGEKLPAATVIWTAGVKPSVPRFEGVEPTLVGGRISVDGCFRMLRDESIYAMGDVAAYMDPDSKANKPLPQLAQVAEAQAETVAGNILAGLRGQPQREFHFHSKGSMVSVGQWFAIGEIFSMQIAGGFTWWLWRTVYLFKFASWRKRTRIGFEWFIAMFFPRDITKI